MSDKPHEEEDKKSHLKLTAAEQKARSRKKLKEIRDGTYIQPLLDKVKAEIVQFESLNADVLERYKGQLTDLEIKQVRDHFYNTKKKLKRHQQESSSIDQTNTNISEKSKKLENQQLPLLHNALLIPLSYEDRKNLIQEKINENRYLFLEYMENYYAPTTDFLQILLELYDSFQESTSVKLFIRICAMHKGETLSITPNMILRGMEFLLEDKVDNIAAFGLLRLAYQNNISFTSISVKTLIDFQNQYEQIIQSFFKSIAGLKSQVIESLPPTCFIFTRPFITELKLGGDSLHEQVPYKFLPSFIEILSYSFENEEQAFESFILNFKEKCSINYYRMLSSKFNGLLYKILSQTKERQPKFFKSLDHIQSILDKAFQLLREQKIEYFDSGTIDDIIGGDQEQFIKMKSKPTLLKKKSKNDIDISIKKFQELNSGLDYDSSFFRNPLSQDAVIIFKALGLENLHPTQNLCLQYFTQKPQKSINFVKFDIGYGKTSLCIGLAYFFAQQDHQVIILNNSDYLLLRDFKKASQISQKMAIDVSLLDSDIKITNKQTQIVMTNLSNLVNLAKIDFFIGQSFSKTLIIDEYDQIFFRSPYQSALIIDILKRFDQLLALSGSHLLVQHKQFLQQALQADFVDFSISPFEKVLPNCLKEVLCKTVKEYNNFIKEICLTQTKKTPIIIIGNSHYKGLLRELQKQGHHVVDLYGENEKQIDSQLNMFLEKNNGQFSIFIINQSQGRGLDFVSNLEIEAAGGIYLIIGVFPESFVEFQQFLGRTGRIGNKGQYSIIIYDRIAQNIEGKNYVQTKLLELKNQDILMINSIKNSYQSSDQALQKPQQQQVGQNQSIQNDIRLNLKETNEESQIQEGQAQGLPQNQSNFATSQKKQSFFDLNLFDTHSADKGKTSPQKNQLILQGNEMSMEARESLQGPDLKILDPEIQEPIINYDSDASQIKNMKSANNILIDNVKGSKSPKSSKSLKNLNKTETICMDYEKQEVNSSEKIIDQSTEQSILAVVREAQMIQEQSKPGVRQIDHLKRTSEEANLEDEKGIKQQVEQELRYNELVKFVDKKIINQLQASSKKKREAKDKDKEVEKDKKKNIPQEISSSSDKKK